MLFLKFLKLIVSFLCPEMFNIEISFRLDTVKLLVLELKVVLEEIMCKMWLLGLRGYAIAI